MDLRLYLLQRGTALLMVPLVLGHLAVIFIAVGDGLTAAEILARTKGSPGWAIFYGAFVVAVAVHAAIGLRAIAMEWLRLGRTGGDLVMWASGLVLLVMGLRGVIAVVLPGVL